MNYEPPNDQTIRRFLLGDLPLAEQEDIEIRLLADAELQTAVEVAEFDLIDDYVRGDLPAKELADFVGQFLITGDRRVKVKTARALLHSQAMAETGARIESPENAVSVKDRKRKILFDWRWVAAPAMAVVLILGIGLFIRYRLAQSPVNQGLSLLKESYREKRPIESRLSGFDHAKFDDTLAAGERTQSPEDVMREEAASLLRQANLRERTPESRWALGCYYLLLSQSAAPEGLTKSRRQTLDDALAQLRQAHEAEPNNARFRNDLGVALMELGKRVEPENKESGESLRIFAEAYEHFSAAFDQNRNLLEALFNKALAAEQMRSYEDASSVWRQYLERDGGGEWAKEAREHLDNLEKRKGRALQERESLQQEFLNAALAGDDDRLWKSFSLSRSQTGNAVTERLIDQYLDDLARNRRDEAGQTLNLLARAAELEANPGPPGGNPGRAEIGDPYTRDVVNFYSRVNARQIPALAKARALFKEARAVNPTAKEKSRELYQQARALFAQAGSECEARLADLLLGVIHRLLNEHAPGRAMADELARYSRARGYHWLFVQSLILRSDLSGNRYDFHAAIGHSLRALPLARKLRDYDSELVIYGQLAIEYRLLGEDRQSFDWLRRALDLMGRYPLSPLRGYLIYGVMSTNHQELDLLHAAAACEKEALHLAVEAKRPLQQSRSHAFLSEIYSRLNAYDDAFAQINQALQIGREMEADAMGQNVIAHSLVRLGHLYRLTGQSAPALEHYEKSLELYKRLGIINGVFEANKGKLSIHLLLGDAREAQKDLSEALRLLNNNRDRIREDSLRNSYFDTGQEVYDLAVELYAGLLRDDREAFTLCDQGRAGTLRDSIGAEAIDARRIGERAPDSVQIVQYAALSRSLRIWVVSDSVFQSVSLPIRADDLNAKVRDYLACAATDKTANDERAKRLAKELYTILIKPVEPFLSARKQICFVPDESLSYLPFAALIEPESERYLVEQYEISFAPSSAVFLRCSELADEREKSSNSERAVSVGDPEFNQRLAEQFPVDLTPTARLAESVAGSYAQSRLLTGKEANKEMFRREAPNAEVIHIATHGFSNRNRPELSGVALADGFLQAVEVEKMKLPHTRLVVLSACETGLGRNYRGEGMVGLTRAFLVARAPLVVSSLWAVGAKPTEKLMTIFHQLRTQSGANGRLSTAQALRQAQIAMLKQQHRPYDWAAFAVFGGYAKY